MKILWLVNFEIPILGNTGMVKEGWITGMLSAVREYYPHYELYLLYPQDRSNRNETRNTNGVNSIGYYRSGNPTDYNPILKNVFADIIKNILPDVVHVMGTEFPHTFSMCEACETLGMLDRLVISVQGIVNACAEVYEMGIPFFDKYKYVLKDYRLNSIHREKKWFEKRGDYEIKALNIAQNVIGRTEWDEMNTKIINPSIKYFHNNEVLRELFYKNTWKYEECKHNTVFISQADYPIKGLHIILEGAKILKKLGYDIQYRIGGYNIMDVPKKREGAYIRYIKKLMMKYSLITNFVFLGNLSEQEMINEYKRANIFLLSSLIENSPNSLGEAMILGMPVISSDVGGVKNFIHHGKDGFIFPITEPNIMAYYIIKYLENPKMSVEFGRNAAISSQKIHSRKENADSLIQIYESIS